MNSNTLSKFRLFGKVGKILMTILSVIAALAAVCCCTAAIFTASLPADALTVRVVEHAEFRFNETSFGALWNILGGSFTYSGEYSPEHIFADGKSSVTPPENSKFEAELTLPDRTYASAEIHSNGNTKIMEAESAPSEYNAKSLLSVFIFAALLSAALTAALWLLRGLFAALIKCETPFCPAVVSKLKGFAFALLPAAVFASVGETMAESFLSAGRLVGIRIQWGFLIAFAVTMALAAVFKYGVQLQKESDETL